MSVKHLVGAHESEWRFDSATQRHIYLEMAYVADRRGIVRQSAVELASVCLLSVPTVRRELARLTEIGAVAHIAHSRYALRYPRRDAHRDAAGEASRDNCGVCGEMVAGETDRVRTYTTTGLEVPVHQRCWNNTHPDHQIHPSAS